jgi:hypothetical protein
MVALSAQSSVYATLSGRVDDPSGALVPGASVVLTNQETGAVETTTTSEGGSYQFARIAPGRYTLTASLAGFGTARQNLALAVNDVAVLNVALPLETLATAVTVQADATISSRATAASTLLDRELFENLPLLGRDFQRVMLIAPGLVTSQSRGALWNPAVSGTRNTSNNFTIDGMSLNEERSGAVGLGPGEHPGFQGLDVPNIISTEAVEEVRVVTSNADASFGRGAGAQVNVVTRSGTNTLHGSAYGYFRNSRWDARDFFNRGPYFDDGGKPIPPPLHYRMFGGTAGGPFARNRHFFFVNYEGFRQQEDLISNATLPNAALIGLIPGDLGRVFQTYFLDTGTGVVPRTGNPVGDFRAFSAAERAAAAAAGFPAALFDGDPANGEAGVTVTSVAAPQEYAQDSMLMRTDHRVSDRVTLTARYARAPNRFERRSAITGGSTVWDRRYSSGLGQLVATLTPTQILEVRGGWVVNPSSVCAVDTPSALEALRGLTDRGFNTSLLGTTGFSLAGVGSPCGRITGETVPQVSAVHAWTRGELTLRSGVDFRYLDIEFANYDPTNRAYEFNGLVGPNGLLGASPSQAQAVAQVYTTTTFGGNGFPETPMRLTHSLQQDYFVQADWRVSSRLSANLGVRYSIFGVYDHTDDVANLYAVDPATNQPVPGVSPLTFGLTANRIEPVTPELPLYRRDLNNLQPRIGAAWDLFGEGRTIVKGAYGLYHERLFPFAFNDVPINVPFAFAGTATSVPFLLGDFPATNPLTPRIFTVDPAITNPYVHRTNIGVDQQLGRRTNVFFGYVGTFGRNQARIVDLNFGPAFPQASRPDSRFGVKRMLTNFSTTRYDALQVHLRSNPARGLTASVAYTYSRLSDFAYPDTAGAATAVPGLFVNTGASAAAGFQVGSFVERPMAAEEGTSDLNLPHVLAVSHVIDVPFGRNRHWGASAPAVVDAVLGGWSVSGTLQARSGAPVNITSGSDFNDDANNTDRPALLSGSLDDLYARAGTQYLVSQAAARALLGVPATAADPFAQVPRNALRSPSVWTYDMSLRKSVPIRGRAAFGFEINLYNLFNRVNLGLPNANLSSVLFGTITSTVAGFGARRVQLGGRVTF